MPHNEYVDAIEKAFDHTMKEWTAVHTIQLQDRPYLLDCYGLWTCDQLLKMAKKMLQSNLAL